MIKINYWYGGCIIFFAFVYEASPVNPCKIGEMTIVNDKEYFVHHYDIDRRNSIIEIELIDQLQNELLREQVKNTFLK